MEGAGLLGAAGILSGDLNTKLPTALGLWVAPGEWVLHGTNQFAATRRDEALAIDGDHFEPEMIGATQGGNGFFAKSVGQMFLE